MGTQAATSFNTFEIVQTGVVSVGATSSVTNWTTVTHNLGYVPIPEAYLDGVNVSGIFTNGVIPLPTHINSSVSGGVYQFNSYMFCATDKTFAYFIFVNATGSSISNFPVKYYLRRERAT